MRRDDSSDAGTGGDSQYPAAPDAPRPASEEDGRLRRQPRDRGIADPTATWPTSGRETGDQAPSSRRSLAPDDEGLSRDVAEGPTPGQNPPRPYDRASTTPRSTRRDEVRGLPGDPDLGNLADAGASRPYDQDESAAPDLPSVRRRRQPDAAAVAEQDAARGAGDIEPGSSRPTRRQGAGSGDEPAPQRAAGRIERDAMGLLGPREDLGDAPTSAADAGRRTPWHASGSGDTDRSARTAVPDPVAAVGATDDGDVGDASAGAADPPSYNDRRSGPADPRMPTAGRRTTAPRAGDTAGPDGLRVEQEQERRAPERAPAAAGSGDALGRSTDEDRPSAQQRRTNDAGTEPRPRGRAAASAAQGDRGDERPSPPETFSEDDATSPAYPSPAAPGEPTAPLPQAGRAEPGGAARPIPSLHARPVVPPPAEGANLPGTTRQVVSDVALRISDQHGRHATVRRRQVATQKPSGELEISDAVILSVASGGSHTTTAIVSKLNAAGIPADQSTIDAMVQRGLLAVGSTDDDAKEVRVTDVGRNQLQHQRTSLEAVLKPLRGAAAPGADAGIAAPVPVAPRPRTPFELLARLASSSSPVSETDLGSPTPGTDPSNVGALLSSLSDARLVQVVEQTDAAGVTNRTVAITPEGRAAAVAEAERLAMLLGTDSPTTPPAPATPPSATAPPPARSKDGSARRLRPKGGPFGPKL